MGKALFESRNLIGDGINVSPALRAWYGQRQDWEIDIWTLNDHAACLYSHMGVPLKVIFEEPTGDYQFRFAFDCCAAFAVGDREHVHMADAYARLLNVEIPNLQPTYIPDENPEWLSSQPKKMVLISPFSRSCSSQKGGRPNKMLPWAKWQHILRYIRGLGYPVRVLGAPTDRADALDFSEEEYICGLDLNRIALLMRDRAVLLVTIDNGMAHFAASQSCPTLEFYPMCLDIHWAVPYGNPHIVPIQMDPAEVSVSALLTLIRVHIPRLLSVRA